MNHIDEWLTNDPGDRPAPKCSACGLEIHDHLLAVVNGETMVLCSDPAQYTPMDEKDYADLADEARLERWESER